jgi:hypothetical protein
MDIYQLPEIPCLFCGKPVNLQTDTSTDENGKAIHTDCYVRSITGAQTNLSVAARPWYRAISG